MALTAIKRGMLIRILFMQPLLITVTGNTDRLHLTQFAEIDNQRLVQVVAADTVFQREVPATGLGMTAVTFNRKQLAIRLVLRMTSDTTGQIRLVRSALGVQRRCLISVTGRTKDLWNVLGLMQADITRFVS